MRTYKEFLNESNVIDDYLIQNVSDLKKIKEFINNDLSKEYSARIEFLDKSLYIEAVEFSEIGRNFMSKLDDVVSDVATGGKKYKISITEN